MELLDFALRTVLGVLVAAVFFLPAFLPDDPACPEGLKTCGTCGGCCLPDPERN